MTIISDFQTGVAEALKYGLQIRFRYFNVNVQEDYYDDDVILTRSGNDFWTSGVVLPISNARGSSDAVLLEQGKILMNDTKLYIDGSINTSGTWKLGLGSNDTNIPVSITGEYSLLSEGTAKWSVNATPILKKLYIRRLTTGSLMGE